MTLRGGIVQIAVSTRSRPKAAEGVASNANPQLCVSTRSRPKAADHYLAERLLSCRGFNTQPPEGG